ncbi:MAG: hypothetical protein RIT04_468 [Candidatus Parcubacteria bacterium]|jgi:hypothetical protein
MNTSSNPNPQKDPFTVLMEFATLKKLVHGKLSADDIRWVVKNYNKQYSNVNGTACSEYQYLARILLFFRCVRAVFIGFLAGLVALSVAQEDIGLVLPVFLGCSIVLYVSFGKVYEALMDGWLETNWKERAFFREIYRLEQLAGVYQQDEGSLSGLAGTGPEIWGGGIPIHVLTNCRNAILLQCCYVRKAETAPGPRDQAAISSMQRDAKRDFKLLQKFGVISAEEHIGRLYRDVDQIKPAKPVKN